jgi:SAM-dependent methyltransferase
MIYSATSGNYESSENVQRRQRIKRILTKLLPFGLFGLIKPYVASGNRNDQWLRRVMNQETRKLVAALSPETLDVLEISGNDWRDIFAFKSHEEASYPSFDICSGVTGKQYDLIIAEQVFEHLLYPYRAGRNVFEMLKDGGHLLITTPFLLRIHCYPVDCTRWTPIGLEHFLSECGFPHANIQVFSWGNRACAIANFHRWQIYQPWRHSLDNEPDFPCVVWALARKP